MLPSSVAITFGTLRGLFGLETPAQLTNDLLIYIFLLALGVGVVYVILLIWTLSKHLSHEPLARDKPLPPRRPPPSRGH